MKKIIKWIIRVIIVLMLLGAFSYFAQGQEEYTEKQYRASGITQLVFKDINNAVHVVQSADNQVHITYFDGNKSHYEITEKNGVLTVTHKSNREWYEIFDFSFLSGGRQVVLALPKSALESIEITTTNGAIKAEEVALGGNLTLGTTNGKITVADLNIAGSLTLRSTNAALAATSVAARDFSMQSTNGSITVGGLIVNKYASLGSTNGSCKVEMVRAESLGISTTNGKITFTDVQVSKSLICSSTNASITGDVAGKESDFSITSRTTNGKNNLPTGSTAGAKQMKITTTNGNISVSFSE